MNLQRYLKQHREKIDQALDRWLPAADTLPTTVHRAMRYSVFAGGKRLRPILTVAASEASGGYSDRVLPAACAIEMIHTYSLIHDDLPAMDDDDFRRGQPTNHKEFGEAAAILAGDALLTQAFILLSDPGVCDMPAELLRQVVHIMATASGSMGMVGGQMVDMEAEGQEVDLPTLEYIHTHKTGALILAAVRIGGLLGGADAKAAAALKRYGATVGLAFQIADDVLDVIGEQQALGKDVGSDQGRKKATYPALLGLDPSRIRARELGDLAVAALDGFGGAADPLREIARYAINRTN